MSNLVNLLVPSIIALLTALYPAPWHLRTRNIATLSMIFWMTALNLVHIVNCLVWNNSAEIKARAWGDISSLVLVGYNFGLPLAHMILAKQLEAYTTLRSKSPLYDSTSRRRHKLVDLSFSIIGPIAGILLHLSTQDRRFYVVEGFGPMAATYWDTWGVILMAIIPIVIAGAAAVYTIMALVNVYLRRQQMLSLIASDASVNKEQFFRLYFLTIAEMGTCGLRAIFNLVSFQHGPQPLGHRGPPVKSLSLIESISSSDLSSTNNLVLQLQWYTVVACSFVFFLCFATSTETKKFWNNLFRRVFCIKESPQSGSRKLGSWDASTSAGTKKSPFTSTGTATSESAYPVTPKEAYSLEEMLGKTTIGKNREEAIWDEHKQADMYIASYEGGKGE
ncbi:pheromone a factor receptor [Tremella mesenterica]|uniref:Pheromone a factor receptor n=1 Tax=Tremella mesenterica TaxID=5217 RepID=A0A4Q1BUU4_TREME|nr:pheromone a factor receptor [Tremella mesenterica]